MDWFINTLLKQCSLVCREVGGSREGWGALGWVGAGSLGTLKLLCVYLEQRCCYSIFSPKPHSYLGHICTFATFILRARLHLGFFCVLRVILYLRQFRIYGNTQATFVLGAHLYLGHICH